MQRYTPNAFIIILFIAAALRLYRITGLTEFLGDQGRTLLILNDWITRGIMPLAGPTTLSGHHLGPVFYYLIMPPYLVSPGPQSAAVWMALAGVAAVWMLYLVTREMFGMLPAVAVSLLWAVSPAIVTADRVIWEPNLVPLFSLLFVFLLYRAHYTFRSANGSALPTSPLSKGEARRGLYKLSSSTPPHPLFRQRGGMITQGFGVGLLRGVRLTRSAAYWLALGAVTGILVQLHVPNIMFIGLTGLYLAGVLVLKKRTLGECVIAGAWWAAGFFVLLLPFLVYESQVGFRDVAGVFGVIGSSAGEPVGKRMMLNLSFDYASRVAGRMLPFTDRWIAGVLLAMWLVYAGVKRRLLHYFLTVWLGLGILAMVRFRGVVHDHYLYFLLPVPFLMLASAISGIRNNAGKAAVVVLIGMVAFFRLTQTDIFTTGTHDIVRVNTQVSYAKKLLEGRPFSFTLVGSRSFSDLHYRFFMERAGMSPVPVAGGMYPVLLLFCDNFNCPRPQDIASTDRIPVLCYDHHCSGEYPVLDMNQWQFVRSASLPMPGAGESRIYIFSRRSDLAGLE